MRNGQARIRIGVAVGLTASGLISGQTLAPTGDLTFEVASFKPSPRGLQSLSLQPASGGTRYVGSNVSLRVYLSAAFRLKADQIIGGPGWFDSEPYDMDAEAAKPSTLDELHIMLQNLLKDRMKLQYHIEKKEKPAYVLSVAKGGPKNLSKHPNPTGTDFLLDETTQPGYLHKWIAHCASMDLFAFRLERVLDEPVLNNTGLADCYEFEITFLSIPPSVPPPEPGKDKVMVNGVLVDLSGPRIAEVLEGQFGLKLEDKKGLVDTMVIDHAERPSEN